MTREELLNLTNCKDDHELPKEILKILLSSEKDIFLEKIKINSNLQEDIFIEYYQENQADRGRLKQDYTPASIGALISELSRKVNSIGDVCAGTGSLTVQQLNKNENAKVYCEEISERALGFLLTNLAIRNCEGIVIHGDSLTREIYDIYILDKGIEFSKITKTEKLNKDVKHELIITNPPYSLPWTPIFDERFWDYELPPKSKADYAFIIHAFNKLADNGQMFAVVPHGLLFRGG